MSTCHCGADADTGEDFCDEHFPRCACDDNIDDPCRVHNTPAGCRRLIAAREAQTQVDAAGWTGTKEEPK